MELPKLRLPNLNASGLQTSDKFNMLGDYLLTMERNLRFVLSHLEEDNFSEGVAMSFASQTEDTQSGAGKSAEVDPTVPEWAKQENPPVKSVNGQTGDVFLELGSKVEQYPVGSIYISTSNTSPATIYGGTWEQITDRFLLAAGSSYTAGSTGGAATHTLTASEMPNHYHLVGGYYKDPTAPGFPGYFNAATVNAYEYVWYAPTSAAGGDMPHNNMPPYLTVYMWRRVA